MTSTGSSAAAQAIVELVFWIEPYSAEKQGYPVHATLHADRQTVPYVETLQLDLDLLARKLLVPEEYDKLLRDSFFKGGVLDAFRMARTLAARPNTVLRVCHLINPKAEEIHKVRWECLKDDKGLEIFDCETTLFSRYLATDRPRPLGDGTCRKALIVIANPPGLGDDGQSKDPENPGGKLAIVDVAEEKERAESALKSGFEIITLAAAPFGKAPATTESIINELGSSFDGILYLVCHGGFVNNVPMLWLEDGDKPVPAATLIEYIGKMTVPPRLVVLASCQSAGTPLKRKAASGTLAALGPQLGSAGVPAIVAMQGCIEMETVDHFMPVFFSRLLEHGQIDRAVGMARAAAKRHGCKDYWMPVLFMRLDDGQLWSGPSPAKPARVCNVPAPPSRFVPRPGLADAIVTALIGAPDGAPGANTAVQGAGGFGKTTLAIDVCLRAEVVKAFPGGVLWTSIGTNPDLLQILSDLYVVAKGVKPAVAGLGQLVQALAETLRERSCLIAIDDVWRADDLKLFLQMQGSRLLVTTRNQNLISEAGEDGWREVPVDEMEPGEAAALLSCGLKPEDPPTGAFERLAKQLGCWPLLMDLVNARLREEAKPRPGIAPLPDGAKAGPGIGFVSKLFKNKGVLSFDQRDSDLRTSAVARSVEFGLEWADKMFPGVARKASEISIFPENIAIAVEVLQNLWQLDDDDIREHVLRPLDSLSLLRWDPDAREVRVHMMIDRALGERLKLNNADGGPAGVHRRLIDAWGNPHRLPHPYAWRWFGWHCKQAGEQDRLKELLLDFSWLRAKLHATDANELIGEFGLIPGGDRQLELLRSAVRLSAHVLAKDESQLAGQLLGRIPEGEESLRAGILKEALRPREPALERVWLRPLRPVLTLAGGSLVRTLAGHSAAVCGVAVTADGKRVVSASRDSTLKVLELETGVVLRTLAGHSARVTGVAVTADGSWVVSASADKTLKVWDLEKGKELRTLKGHAEGVNGVAVSADGKRAVSASDDKTLNVWDLEKGLKLRTLKGHSRRVNEVAVTADGRQAVSASDDTTLKVWDLEKGVELRTLKGHSRRVNCVAVTADGRQAVSASHDWTLKVWDLEKGVELRTLKGHSDWVTVVAVTADGKRAVSASEDKTLKVWDLQTGVELRTLEGPTSVNGLAVTADRKWAVSASFDNMLQVWDISQTALQGETGAELRTLEGHFDQVNGVAVTADGTRAVSASSDNTLKVWDLKKGMEVCTLGSHAEWVVARLSVNAELGPAPGDDVLRYQQQVAGVSVTSDGAWAVSASFDWTLSVWDLEKGVKLRTLKGHSRRVAGVAVTADGTRAVSASDDQTLRVWDLETGLELRTLEGHSQAVNGVAVTADGTRAVSASDDNTLKVWDISQIVLQGETGVVLRTLKGHSAAVNGVAVTADGKRAVSASADKTLKVWDISQTASPGEPGVMLRTLEGHSDRVNGVAVTADGKRVVSASDDKTLKVWDLETGELLATSFCDGSTHCCAFASDRGVVAGDSLGRVHLIHLEEPGAKGVLNAIGGSLP